MRNKDVIGLIPCGGYATRISPLPCSKELLPVGVGQFGNGKARLQLVSEHLLEKMRTGGVSKAFLILRKGKWDIPEYYGDGKLVGLDLGYLMVGPPYGPPYTLDQAYPFVRGATIAIGFPDILFTAMDAFGKALQRLRKTKAELVLGLFKAHDPQMMDMVEIDEQGQVHRILLKPQATDLRLTWLLAVWTPRFTEFLHTYLKSPRTSAQQVGRGLPPELTAGHVVEAALQSGLRVQSVIFPSAEYLDIGTPLGLQRLASGRWAKATRVSLGFSSKRDSTARPGPRRVGQDDA